MGDEANAAAQTIAFNLRQKGIRTETDHMSRGLKPQMKYSNKIDAEYTLVLGDSELESGDIKLKNMLTGEQIDCRLDKLVGFFKEDK